MSCRDAIHRVRLRIVATMGADAIHRVPTNTRMDRMFLFYGSSAFVYACETSVTGGMIFIETRNCVIDCQAALSL